MGGAMALFSKLLGGNRRSKVDLIKDLVKERIRGNPTAEAWGATPDAIESLPEMMLMSLPEATIVTIVEAYVALKPQNLADSEILESIEAHRSMITTGTMPRPLTLTSYIKYRVALEHSHGAPILEKFIDGAVQESLRNFSR
jgi:hypothetical protein